MDKPIWIVRKIRLLFGFCPYCGKRMLNGMGGRSPLFLSGLKVCPDKHYAEEMVLSAGGAILIHDNGGKPLPIQGLGDEIK
jgi:hypothetical protein